MMRCLPFSSQRVFLREKQARISASGVARGTPRIAVLVSVAALFSCSDIQRNTFEVELTTDREPQVVELWYQPRELSNELKPAYRLEFPQSYYSYRDNHRYLKQTMIGLLLEKRDLLPLTEVIARETGIHETLSISHAFEGALKRQITGPYRERKLWVVISGLSGRQALTRAEMPRVFISSPVLYHDIDIGFDIVKKESDRSYGNTLPLVVGYSSQGPVIRMSCLPDVPNCSFGTEYRNSYIDFVLPRSEAKKAHIIVPKLVDLIQRHIVEGEE